MKYLKVLVPVLVVVAMLLIALPTGAQGPMGVKPFVRVAGTNEDPFGGFPVGYGQPGYGATGIARFGITPFQQALQGGVPSDKSGDGTSARKSVYVGGAWGAGPGVAGYGAGRAANENPMEIPSCATVKSPAGTSRWFKMDTWKDKRLQVWLDDELNTATAPSGSAVFGAGDLYMWGIAPQDAINGWAVNWWDVPGITSGATMSGPFIEGWVMAILDPNNMRPNFAYNPPNAALYTVAYSAAGSPRRAGQGSNPPSDNGRGVSVSGIIGETNVHGYGQYNKNQPSHLLFYEATFDGWVHARVYNQMIWDGVVTVCSYRAAGK